MTTDTEVFVFGGSTKSGFLDSYETIGVDYVQSEGVLPFRWAYGCSTLIDNTTILLAGGFKDGTFITEKTWLLNFKTEEWTQGPSMNIERREFGCGLIKSIDSFAAFGGFSVTTEIVKLPGGSFKLGNH